MQESPWKTISTSLLTTFIKNPVPFFSLERSGGKSLDLAFFYAVGTALIVAGIIVIVAAIIVASAKGAGAGRDKDGKSRVRGGGVIMIGPIPIIFGTDKKSVKTVLVLALALVIAAIIAMLLYYWILR